MEIKISEMEKLLQNPKNPKFLKTQTLQKLSGNSGKLSEALEELCPIGGKRRIWKNRKEFSYGCFWSWKNKLLKINWKF